MSRDDQLTELNREVLRDLPEVLDAWLGEARAGLERLTRAACDEGMPDEEFRTLVADYLASGQLLRSMRPAALAGFMAEVMGSAAAIGHTSAPKVHS